jgi:tRNA(Ile)-lysidine synthase
MSSVLDVLRRTLGERLRSGAGFCVALSGGLDSSVLLHGMCALRPESPGIALRAVHVNHGLHPQADEWARACERLCGALDVPLLQESVEIDVGGGKGPEAAARSARYGVFERLILRNENLLTAHHQDDQVETVLLRLLRGSGPHGLGGIPADVRFGGGWLCRPFLDLRRQALNEYAESMGLDWLDDPSNTDTNFDRNYLRHEILPLLKKRWPGIGKTIGRAARLSGDAAGMLDALAENDSQGLIEDGALSLAGLRSLSPSRQCNVVRNALIRRGLKAPSELRLKSGLDQLMSAKPDRQPKVCWGRIQVRRYRDRLFFLDFDPSAVSSTFPNRYQWDGRAVLEMGPVRGRLTLVPDTSGSISIPALAEGIVVKFRQGGEQIKKAKNEHHTVLKKLFQQRGILPWMRSHVPLLYVQDRLIAVGDLWVAADAAASQSDQCFRIAWENHPPIQ